MNMMKINHLEWDSNFFNKKIGEVTIISDDNIDIATDYDLIITKQLCDKHLKLEGYTLSFQETKLVFSKIISSSFEFTDDVSIKDTDSEPRTQNFFKILAYESGKKSRFLLDKRFGEKKFKKLYDKWITNSLNKKFALKTFYIEKEGDAIAFITLQKNNTIARIGLLSTHPNFQGQGFGKLLLKHVENFCVRNNIKELEIPTQKENTQACAFYHNQGYYVKDELILKHYWKNDPFQ